MSQASLESNTEILVGKMDANHELLMGNAALLAQIAASIEKIAMKVGA